MTAIIKDEEWHPSQNTDEDEDETDDITDKWDREDGDHAWALDPDMGAQ